MADRLIAITAGTPAWSAWLKHYRRTGNRNELRMLACQRRLQSFLVPARYPPETPRADRVTPKENPAPVATREHYTAPEGEADRVATRLEAADKRREQETAEQKKRRKLLSKRDRELEEVLEAVREGRTPRINGGDELGTLNVPDVDEHGRMGVFTKVVNLRDDPVGQMAKRGHLGVGEERDIRLKAARHWQRLYEQAEIGGARGIDPTRDVVDGGRFETGDTDVRLAAFTRLNQICRKLYLEDERLLTWVLEQKRTLKEYAVLFSTGGERRVAKLGDQFNRALDEVATFFGYRVEGRRGRSHYDVHAAMATAAYSPELHRAVHRARTGEKRG